MFYENYGGGGAYYEDVSHITYTENENKLGISPMLLTEDYRTLGIPLSLEGLEDFYLYNGFFCFYGGLFGKPSKNLEKMQRKVANPFLLSISLTKMVIR